MPALTVAPAKPVQVCVDDVWHHPGTLEAWRREGDRWRGYVRWSAIVGMRHLGWVDLGRVRAVASYDVWAQRLRHRAEGEGASHGISSRLP